MNYIDWIEGELRKREWSRSDLSRKSGITTAQISRVLNGDQNPGHVFHEGMARAFNVPLETVLRAAKVLQPVSERDALKEDFNLNFNDLTPDEQRIVASIVKGMKEAKKNNRKPKGAEATA
jgi:transcriptional regulator with XRE-family HTH domain